MQSACPTENHLREFFDGSMDDAKAEKISAHLADCPSCDGVICKFEHDQNSLLRIIREDVENRRLLQEPEFQQLQNTILHDAEDTTPELDPNDCIESGKRLGDYRLVRKIGEGGMGTVYQAIHIHLAKSVALKILPQDKLHSQQSVRRFRQEMRAVGRVNHPNVVSASDAGTIDGQLYLVMELVEGADLARIIQSRGTLDVADACEIVRQAALGLQHAHDNELVHRDVKPSNVMLTVDGNVKLLDLGLAGLNNTEIETDTTVAVTGRLTSVGQIMGTLDFMAPEQLLASPDVDCRADVYALGSTLFQLLTGRTPCGERSDATPKRIEAVLNEPPLDINTLRDDIPPGLRDLLLRLLAKSPEDRPQSADEVAQDIQRFAPDARLVALAEECKTSLDIPSADVDVTHDVSFLVSRMVEPEKQPVQRKPFTARAFLGACLALIAAAVFYIATNTGVVKLEVLDESFQVAIDGETVRVTEEGNNQPTNLRVGDHKLTVTVGGTEFVTSDFEIRRSDKVAFRIEPLEGKVIVTRDGIQVASKPMPGVTPPSSLERAGQQMNESWQEFFEHHNEEDIAEEGAMKLIDFAERLEARGDIDEAVDFYLKAFRLNSGSFDWNKIPFFKEAGRLGEVADCFDVEAIRSPLGSLSPITTYSSLIKALMADPSTRQQGLRLFRDFYASRIPGSQSFPFGPNNGFGIDWKTIPDPIFYFRNKFLPIDFEKAGDGWDLFGNLTENRYGPETQDGWFSETRPLFVHRDAMRQFTDELREAVAQHKSWKAGVGYLAAFETELGNFETAATLLNENVMGPDRLNLPAGAAWMLGQAIEGKSEELDRIAIQLFEHALPQIAKPGSVEQYRKPLRLSPVFRLARLYRENDRKEDARQLLQGLVRTDNQHPLVKGYVPGVSGYCHNSGSCSECHRSERNFYGIATYSEVMTEFGYPVDSLLSLARIDESFSVNPAWQSKSLYKDFQKQKSNAAKSVTPRVVLEALQDGSLASAAQLDRSPLFYARRGDIDSAEEENRLLLALKPEQVRPSVIGLRLAVRGPKARSTVFSPVIDVLKLAADFDGEDAEADKDRLDDLLRLRAETHPGDVQAAVASTAFAFLRNDLATAKSRLEALQEMKLSEGAQDQEANASLWLVARYALKHDSTGSLGEALATKALKAAQMLPAKNIENAILRERADTAAANAPKTIAQRIEMDLNPAELRQLTDELLEIYRNGPGGLPRKQIGGDRLVFNAFKKAGRLVELGKCIGETAELSEECDLVTARETIEALMKDDQTRAFAYQTLEKVFKVSHEVRSQVLANPENFGVDWKTAPNAIIYLRASLLPARLNRYQRPFSKSLFGNKKAVREFTDEVRLLHAKNRGAKAPLLLLAVLESEIGNLEAAEKIVSEHFIGPDGPTLGSENALTLAYGIVGKNEALDRLAMQLWESKISVQRDGLAYRPLPDLAKLYGKFGRREEARQLLYGLVSPTNQHPLLKGYRPGIRTSCRRYHEQKCSSCHQGETNLTDYTVLSDGLMDLGYPVDSYISLARIDDSFRNIYSSSRGWLELTPEEKNYDRLVEFRNESRDYLFKRRVAQASQKVTPGSVIEALRLGTFEKSPRYTKESYEALRTPISRKQKRTLELEEATDAPVDLMLSVRGVGPEAKATVFSPVVEVLKLAADFEGEGAEEDKDRLDALLRLQSEVNPRDVQAAIASTAFAFLRNDLDTATERLNALERIELTNDVKAQRTNACLWLVARYALANDSTRPLGEALAGKAMSAAKRLSKTRIKEAIHREQMEILSRH